MIPPASTSAGSNARQHPPKSAKTMLAQGRAVSSGGRGRRFKPSHSDHPKAQVPGLFDSSTEANETPAASLDRQGCRKAGAVAGNDPPLEQHQLAWRMGGDGFGDAARGEGDRKSTRLNSSHQ